MMDTTNSPDIAIIGGSFGGVAAALAAAEAGAAVTLTTPTDWIGGQVTNQGVSALDEHKYIESFGGTLSYETFRNQIRSHYIDTHNAPEQMSGGLPLNPGNGWVSRLCFEPAVGLKELENSLDRHVQSGQITIHRLTKPISAEVRDGRITTVTVRSRNNSEIILHPTYVLDATEWGDLLPLVNANYTTGAESKEDTGEPHAVTTHNPSEIQSFTYCFAVEYCPGEDHTIDKPAGYEQFRDQQPYTFEYEDHQGDVARYRMFKEGPEGERPFWTYRRIIDSSLLDGYERDVALINWSGNDYYGDSPIDKTAAQQERIFTEAKRLARGFLYWLQTDAPRDDSDDTGYPGLRLLPEVMGTEDGLSKQPYVREGRRIIPRTRIVEEDIAQTTNRGARARNFQDSVGIGFYGIDLHSCVDNPGKLLHEPTLPYQIPLGALLPQEGPENFLASCKNIGTTHLTNGAYRLHPTEWAIGEAAGSLAANCLDRPYDPAGVYESKTQLRQFQYNLLERGVPLAWTIDVRPTDELFTVTQLLYITGAIPSESPRSGRLEVRPDDPLSIEELRGIITSDVTSLDQPDMIPTDASEDSIADQRLVNRVFAEANIPLSNMSSPPTWRDVSAALSTEIQQRYE